MSLIIIIDECSDLLVGIARTLTDFVWTGYLSDLAVRETHQHKGIGTQLIAHTREHMEKGSSIVLLAAPKAVGYYGKIGFTKMPRYECYCPPP